MCDESGLSGLTQTPEQNHPLSPPHEPLHWRAKRDPKAKMLDLQSFLRKGVSLGYVGLNQNLKDLGLRVCQASGAPGARIERASRALEEGRH